MPTVVIIGAQWGDEGKGKVVDLLAESVDVVVRYAGGPNAGHTLVIGDEKLVFRLVPSGVLHPHTQCVLGQGMVINPDVLIEEIDALEGRGLDIAGRLVISELAHLIMPYHVLIDELRETAAEGTKIGTTKRGIGPCYEDKVGRRGIRMHDLCDLAGARERVREALHSWAPTIRALGSEPPSLDAICEPLAAAADKLSGLLGQTAERIDVAQRAGKRILLEGAQGTMLDVDHGTYPYVTSSSSTAGGACTGAGIGPSRIDHVLGISKAYTTRVGGGPFPTELDDEAGQHMRDVGGEYGSVTGRPRRTGWLDIAALRYARIVNGLDALAVTKLDVLTGLSEIKVCVGYQTPQGRVDSLPVAAIDGVEPIYLSHPGWKDDITGCRRHEQLPEVVKGYLALIEQHSGLPIDLVSVGPRRNETIVVRKTMPTS